MTKIKLWVSDIDGTLMNYDSSYTPRMAELIKKINNSHCKLVLATVLKNTNAFLNESLNSGAATQRSDMADYKKFCL